MKRKAGADSKAQASGSKVPPNPAGIDYRKHPELYKVAKGEQGVLTVEPYKSEILPHWRFRTPEIAAESAAKVSELYNHYKQQDDFVGMDMARKFLQMGYTRAMRYAKHKGGRKYDSNHELLPETINEEKVECAQRFRVVWKAVEADPEYQQKKAEHKAIEKQQKASS
ncbi:hypothetical protein ABBQ38_004200 [Trebouxia sp. C0009 RCD-2024]